MRCKRPRVVERWSVPTAFVLRQDNLLKRISLKVYTASDFPGYTLQHLKAMYPTHWQSAALHFGINVS